MHAFRAKYGLPPQPLCMQFYVPSTESESESEPYSGCFERSSARMLQHTTQHMPYHELCKRWHGAGTKQARSAAHGAGSSPAAGSEHAARQYSTACTAGQRAGRSRLAGRLPCPVWGVQAKGGRQRGQRGQAGHAGGPQPRQIAHVGQHLCLLGGHLLLLLLLLLAQACRHGAGHRQA